MLARAATSEAAALKVRERLLQLLARIHHERTVAGDRLVQRASGHEDGARRTAVASRRDAGEPHLCALAQHGELMGTQRMRIGRRAHLDRALEDVEERG